MVTIQELKRGNEFYFKNNKQDLFVMLCFLYRKDGSIKAAKCCKVGRLYPIFLKANLEVELLKTPVIKIYNEQNTEIL